MARTISDEEIRGEGERLNGRHVLLSAITYITVGYRMTSNKQLQDLLDQVARGDVDTDDRARAADRGVSARRPTRIWGSLASIIIAPSARGFPKSSSV